MVLACSDRNDDAPAGTADALERTASVPDSPVGRRLSWLLAALNGGPVSDAVLGEQFAPSFLAQVEKPRIRAILADFARSAPWALEFIEPAFQSDDLAS